MAQVFGQIDEIRDRQLLSAQMRKGFKQFKVAKGKAFQCVPQGFATQTKGCLDNPS
jgi:hypothetical protein